MGKYGAVPSFEITTTQMASPQFREDIATPRNGDTMELPVDNGGLPGRDDSDPMMAINRDEEEGQLELVVQMERILHEKTQ